MDIALIGLLFLGIFVGTIIYLIAKLAKYIQNIAKEDSLSLSLTKKIDDVLGGFMDMHNNGLKWFICRLSWMIIPPLFYHLAKRWNLMSKKSRVWMFFLSPLFLIIYFVLILFTIQSIEEHSRSHKYTSKAKLEKIIYITVPEYTITKNKYTPQRGYKKAYFYSYSVSRTIEFKEIPSDNFYKMLDSLSSLDNNRWNKGVRDSVVVYSFKTRQPSSIFQFIELSLINTEPYEKEMLYGIDVTVSIPEYSSQAYISYRK